MEVSGFASTIGPVVVLSPEPGDHAYNVAPDAVRVAIEPAHMVVSAEVLRTGTVEGLITTLAESVQLFPSVTVTVYVPAARLFIEGVVWLLLHWYERLPVPPEYVGETEPLL